MRKAHWVLLIASGLLVLGCGGSEPTVIGTVRLDGQLLATGSVTMVPLEGTSGPGGGGAITDGKYEIKRGLRAGQYRVEILSTSILPDRQVLNSTVPTEKVSEEVSIIPEEYNKKSTLIREVGPGGNVLDFNLKGVEPRK